MKKLILLIGAIAASWSWAREAVVIVPAHPDDLITSIGFCLLAREKFDIHVVDLTHGERGLGPEAFEDGSCKRIRTAEEQSVCEAVGAKLHWLDEVDGEAYACRETCEKLAAIMKELKPRAVFAHWPVDIHTDHVMAGAAALRAVFLSGLKPEVYFFDEEYQAKGFVPDHYVDITDVAERKYEILRNYKCQYRDGGIERRKRAGDMVNGMRTAILSLGSAEGFKALYPPLQGERDIFSELPRTPRAERKFQGAKPDWRTKLPRPVFDERPELVEFYGKAWEIAHTRIDNLPGIPVPRYMDEGHRSDWIWIWDTCFMTHFCKYAPWEFPGIESLGNFYGILMPDGAFTLPKVRGNRWSCGPKGLSEPWEGRLLDFKVHLPEDPPLFAWTEYRHALQTGDRARLEKVYREKRWLQRWFDVFENFDPSKPAMFGATLPVRSQKVGDLGYRWTGGSSGMDNTPRGREGEKDLGPKSPADCPNNPDLLWVDAYAQQALAALSISRIAGLLGDADGAGEWRAKYEAKKAKINELYWDEADGFYYDILASDRSKCKVPTMASYWTLLAEIPDAARRARLVEKLRDPDWFGGDIPTPSLARKDADFWPTGGYWRGGVWMPTTYMAVKALDGCGEGGLAREISRKVVFDMCETWKTFEPHTIWECYSPTEAKPSTYAKSKGWVRDNFCGWSALGPIALFIEDVIGVREANAFTNTLVCDFERDPKGRVGVENYRFGKVTCSIIATKESISVESDAPFALVADGRTFQVNAGKNAFVRR